MASSSPKRYDLVLFGASGFTGRYVVEELCHLPGSVTWAVAGRSRAKVQQALKDATAQTGRDTSSIPVIVADVSSAEQLATMCSQAKVVLDVAGPFRLYGEAVVKACVENGASYVDISGEPQFLEEMQLRYDELAKKAGVYIVGSCGFDSIPADMGIAMAQDIASGDVVGAEGFVHIKLGPAGGHGNTGTWESAIMGFANAAKLPGIRRKLYAMYGARPPKPSFALPTRKPMFYSQDMQKWCVVLPTSDASIVRRTQLHGFSKHQQRPAELKTYFVRDSWLHSFLTIVAGIMFGIMAYFSFTRKLLFAFPSIFSGGVFKSGGPTREQVDGATFEFTLVCPVHSEKLPADQQHTSAPSDKLTIRVSGPECGYPGTSVMLVGAAMTVLEEQDKMPPGGGVFPPGAAFRNTNLLERIGKRGVLFERI